MFQIYTGQSSFSLGVNCVGVEGKNNYCPFIQMAVSFGIPAYIISDNDGATRKEVEIKIRNMKQDVLRETFDDDFYVTFLSEGNDIESELIRVLSLRKEVIAALVKLESKGSDNTSYIQSKTSELSDLTDCEIISRMRSSKAKYAGYLADVIQENPNNKPVELLVPKAAIDVFNKLRESERLF